jgi:hypothetical protein
MSTCSPISSVSSRTSCSTTLEALVDQAAALHLSAPWAAESDGEATVSAWAARLTAGAHGLLDHLDRHFADRTPESITEGEIDLAAAQFTSPRSGWPPSSSSAGWSTR